MGIGNDKTLWSDLARTRYFLIPSNQDLPAGAFAIRSGASRQQKVDLTALLSYEISREDAKAWLDSRFENVLEKAKSGFLHSLKQTLEGNAPSVEPNAPMEASKSSPQPLSQSKQTETALSLFSTLMHEPVDSLRSDPEAVIRGLQKIGIDITAILTNATSQSTDDLQTARTQFKSMLEVLRRHGLPVSEQADNLPDKLHELSKSTGSRKPE